PPPGSRLPTDEPHTLTIRARVWRSPGSAPVRGKVYIHRPRSIRHWSEITVPTGMAPRTWNTAVQDVLAKYGRPHTRRPTASPNPRTTWRRRRVVAVMAAPRRRRGTPARQGGPLGRRTTPARRRGRTGGVGCAGTRRACG